MKALIILIAIVSLSSCSFRAGVNDAKSAIHGAVQVKLEPEEACVCLSWSSLFDRFKKRVEK